MKKQVFRKLYQDYFHIPEHTKVPDKVFRFRIAFSVVSIIACIAVMMSSAFALFCSEVTTQNSTLAGANYYITVDGAEDGTYTCPLLLEDEHIFEISAGGSATTGFCEVHIDGETYYTNPIDQGKSVTLTVIAAEGTLIEFTSKIGKPANYGIDNTCGYIIEHSHTPVLTDEGEEGGEGEASQSEENAEIKSGDSSDTSDEGTSSSGETEASGSNTEPSDSSENSNENESDDVTEDTPSEDNDAPAESTVQKDTPSSDNTETSESSESSDASDASESAE